MTFDYIAGIVDGEGTIGLRKCANGYYPYVSICNNHLILIETIRDFLLSHNIKGCIVVKKPYKATHNINYELRFRYNMSLLLIEKIIKFLIVKSNRAELLLNEYKNNTPPNGKYTIQQKINKDNLYNLMRDMNHRGV
jgi:hypothetical protein